MSEEAARGLWDDMMETLEEGRIPFRGLERAKSKFLKRGSYISVAK
jgi:hypothetical protein